VPYTLAGAALAAAADHTPRSLTATSALAGGLAVAAVAAVAAVVVAGGGDATAAGRSVAAFVAAAVAGAGLAAAGGAALAGMPAPAALAVVAWAALATVVLLPGVATRAVRIWTGVPTGKAAMERVDAVDVADRVHRADGLLAGGLVGVATTVAVCGVALSTVQGWAPPLFSLVAGLILVIRGRVFDGRWHRPPLLLAGAVVIGSTAWRLALGAAAPAIGLAVALAVLAVLALGGLLLAATGFTRPASPYLARMIDLVEMALGVASVPLALLTCGLLDSLGGIGG
jgi:hypothetical protein